tara:strand:- start:24969 stop:25295 length:327 start_codon:yes stop_codon:yes gene_type:complete
MKAWLCLSVAIVLEVAGTVCMKLSAGFTRPVPSILVGVFYLISLGFMILAVKTLEISLVYAIWSGLGTALISGVGIFYFNESVTPLKLVSIVLIIVGVVGLHASSPHQ